MRLSAAILSLSLLAGSALAEPNKRAINAVERFANKRNLGQSTNLRPRAQPSLHGRQSSPYLNSNTQQFVVNGSGIPDVDFNVGESYAGLLPISDSPDETRKLFFWFFPSSNPNATDEITIWFNGGPGCSSLSGLLTENGPFLFQQGTLSPTPNSYSWSNLTNMLWVEQPVGVGFSQGLPNITNEIELGQEFAGFYTQFAKAFKLENRKVYLTGESYAGFYVPYIANEFIKLDDPVYHNLAGISINDPIIGDETIQQQVVILPYVEYWSNLFNLNETFMDRLRERDMQCNYTQYYNEYFQFPPPKGPFPTLPDPSYSRTGECDQIDNVYAAAQLANPCFNIYHISDTCPFTVSHLGIVNSGDYNPPGNVIYFNRTDVQKAINAPVGTNWQQCTRRNVFGGPTNNRSLSDTSLGPAIDGTLQNVIEHTNNVIIGSGNLDFLLSTNGTLFVLQNTTWNGGQGFSKYPNETFYVPYHPEYNGGRLAEAGDVGYWVSERGLTFYTVQLAGHELPGYAAGAGYRQLELLLGRIDNLGEMSDFTTQSGNFTGTTPLLRKRNAHFQGGMEIPRPF